MTALLNSAALAAGAGGPVVESSGWFLENVWLIPLIPAIAFLLILFFGKKLPMKGSEVGIASILAVVVLSFLTAGQWMSARDAEVPAEAEHGEASEESGEHSEESIESAAEPDSESASEDDHGTEAAAADDHSDDEHGESGGQFKPVVKDRSWWSVGDGEGGLNISVGTMVDGLTVMMLVTVGIVSCLVHIYSLEYLKGDRRYTHYYAFLSLFSAAMLFYVVSSSLIQMLVAWELVGLCSFALIGHWWEEKANTDAALKAFLTNRVGDIGLLVGVAIIIITTKTSDVLTINTIALGNGSIEVDHLVWLVAACCLMAAVCSKSGQFPLHTWLPDAMAGPTPVSALIHAATMVVAGVFLIARLYPVFWEGLSIGTSSINLMAFLGGFTTIMAGALAFVQRDLKKVLAYSTVSQLGYMVMALGVGAWTAGVFHLFTHAFFKALLFLGAGSVSHAVHHSFDMKSDMGGLRKYMPVTFATFIIGSIALAGLPPLAGFWSKDELLAGAWAGQGSGYPFIFVMGCITALLTAAYMTRACYLTFFGNYRGHGHPHESPAVMKIPLMVLGLLAVIAGFANLPHSSIFSDLPEGIAERFTHYVEPTYGAAFPAVSHSGFIGWVAILSIALAVLGILVAGYYYFRSCDRLGATELPDGLTSRNPIAAKLYSFMENKYYLDHLYTGVIAGGTKGPIARAADWFNTNVLDGIVNGVGRGAVGAGNFIYENVDQTVVDGTVNGAGRVSSLLGGLFSKVQTGKVQQYGALLFGAVALLAILFMAVV